MPSIQTADETPANASASFLGREDNSVLTRINKCLERAYDDGVSEAEAKVALRVASRLMKTLNVTQAEVLAHTEPEERKKHAGQSVVALTRRDEDRSKPVQEAYYLSTLRESTARFFDCKKYTTSGTTAFETTFYGIAENTVAAANAYCMVYNLMVDWARPYKGTTATSSYCHGVSGELLCTAEREKVDEEIAAKKAEEDEFKARVEQEQAERQAQLDRLAEVPDETNEGAIPQSATESNEIIRVDSGLGNSALLDANTGPTGKDSGVSDVDSSDDGGEWEEWNGFSDDDEDAADDEPGFSGCADFREDDEQDDSGLENLNDDDLNAHIDTLVASMNQPRDLSPVVLLPARPAASETAQPVDDRTIDLTATSPADKEVTEAQGTETNTAWKSHMQLVQFRDAAKDIADKHLEEQEIKLYRPRKRKAVQHDWEAYDDGVRDSKKIDVRMKSLPEEASVGAEESV